MDSDAVDRGGLNGLRVLLVGINYLPETSGIAPYTSELAAALHDAGADVRVITGVPHYPAWRAAEPYRWGLCWEEVIEGVRASRRRHWVPARTGLIGRAAMEASFLALAVPAILRDRSTVIIAVTPSLAAVGAATIARRGRPLGVVVQDLVGNAAGQSGTTGAPISSAIASIEYWMLRKADLVGVIASGFTDVLHRHGVSPPKIVEVPNFSRIEPATASRDEARRALGWPIDRFLVVHTGNMGMKQGLGVVVEAARLADDEIAETLFVLVGDGNQRAHLERKAEGIRSLRFVDPLPETTYPLALAAADVLLLCEIPGATQMSLPSKLTSYVTTDRPIIASVEPGGLTHEFISRHGLAHTTPAGSAAALLQAVQVFRADAATSAQASQPETRSPDGGFDRAYAHQRYRAFARTLAARDERGVTFIGHFPPPRNGHSLANERLLMGLRQRNVAVQMIDKGSTGGPLQALRMLRVLLNTAYRTRRHQSPVYMTLGSSRAGLLRDALILLSTSRKRRVVVHLHGGYLADLLGTLDTASRSVVTFAFRRVDRGLVLADALLDEFHTLLPHERTAVLPNGITSGGPEKRGGTNITRSEDLRVLFLSNSLPSKGLGVLIDAMLLLHATHPNWSIDVYGAWMPESGETALAVEARMRAKATPLASSVRFGLATSDDQVTNALAAADVLVLPTMYPNEGQPLAIIEGLVAGLHIVATDHRCIPDMFEDTVDGILVSAQPTPASVAAALEAIAVMPPMTEERRSFHEARWSIDTMMDALLVALHPVRQA